MKSKASSAMIRLAWANSAFQAGRTGLNRVPKSRSRRHYFGAHILAQPQPNFCDLDDDRTVAKIGLTQPLTLAEHLAVHTFVDEYVNLGAAPS